MRLAILSLSLLVLAAAQAATAGPTARYTVTFERTWSSDTHPQDFPLLAHFSPVIGITHSAGHPLFLTGGTATPGIEKLCEEGKHQPLDAEIAKEIEAGSVGALIETSEPIRDVPASATATFEIDERHPLVSIAAMIAPSPDWCAAAVDVELMEKGTWVSAKSVPLYAWDVGTDSATSYRALDADMQPRGPIQLNDLGYFKPNGKRTTVGLVKFVKQ